VVEVQLPGQGPRGYRTFAVYSPHFRLALPIGNLGWSFLGLSFAPHQIMQSAGAGRRSDRFSEETHPRTQRAWHSSLHSPPPGPQRGSPNAFLFLCFLKQRRITSGYTTVLRWLRTHYCGLVFFRRNAGNVPCAAQTHSSPHHRFDTCPLTVHHPSTPSNTR
jgi:hypothetical protein